MNSRDFSAALSTIAIFVMACLVPGIVLAIEEPEYEILEENGGFELRSYNEVILAETRVTPDGPAVFARYDPPFKPWFLRRNEVMIPVKTEAVPGHR